MKRLFIGKRLLIGLIAALSTVSMAMADNPFKRGYLGASIGLGIGHNKLSQNTRVSGTQNFFSNSSTRLSALGAIGGIHGGWNWVFKNKWLVGVEVWGDLASLDDSLNAGSSLGANMKTSDEMEWSIGAALKGGVIVNDSTLAYVSLGWVGSDWETKTTVSSTPALAGANPTVSQTFKHSKFLNGFRPALGVAVKVTNRIYVSGEGAYSFYQSHSNDDRLTIPTNAGPMNTIVHSKSRPQVGEIRLKVSWQLKV